MAKQYKEKFKTLVGKANRRAEQNQNQNQNQNVEIKYPDLDQSSMTINPEHSEKPSILPS